MTRTPQLPWEEDTSTPPLSGRARDLADEMFARIASKQYPFGTRLPAERDVAKDFAVSRETVRKAFAVLQHHAVIERRPGSGSVVRYRPQKPPSDQQSLADLNLGELTEITSPLEYCVVRSIVEPELIRLAVLNMTSRDIERMDDIQGRFDTIASDGETFARLDDELRLHLAAGARNPLLLAIFSLALKVGSKADWAIKQRRSISPGRIRERAARNRALCAAIGSRNIEAAVEQTRLALADFHQELMGNF
ncbi:MAG: FadR/GntR family transcriptional regulator [Geminicoccales bacterium]